MTKQLGGPASAECIFYLKVPPENSNTIYSFSLRKRPRKYNYFQNSGWKIIISFMALLLPGFGRRVAWSLSSRRFLLCSLRYYSSVVHISLGAPLNLEKLTFNMLKCQFLFPRPNTISRHILSYIHTCLSFYVVRISTLPSILPFPLQKLTLTITLIHTFVSILVFVRAISRRQFF